MAKAAYVLKATQNKNKKGKWHRVCEGLGKVKKKKNFSVPQKKS